jgi:hypothetical protein
MRRNQSFFEPSHAGDRQRPTRGRASEDDDDRDEHGGVPDEDEDAYEDDDDRVGQARGDDDDDEPDDRGRVERAGAAREEEDGDDDDGDQRVAHRPNPLPAREEDEEEIAEADIMEVLDADGRRGDDRRGMEGSNT